MSRSRHFYNLAYQTRGFAADCGPGSGRKSLVIGAYDGCNPGEYKLTDAGRRFAEESGGKIVELLKGSVIKKGTAQVFTNVGSEEFFAVSVAGLGSDVAGFNTLETLDECKENIRIAAGAGTRALQDRGFHMMWVEGFTNAEAAAEGATLGVWNYQEFKDKDQQIPTSKVDLYDSGEREAWQRGVLKGECQNIARKLEETPSNYMTPSIFAQKAVDTLCPCGVSVDVRDRDWLELKKMNSFLSIARGSCEPPLLLEVGYCGGPPQDQPVLAIGKGVTFGSGGLCLKESSGMDEARADLAGAAVLIGVFRGVAAMNLPINIQALIPLCENMIGGMSVKPGDVLLGLNGKTLRVEDTGHEGRIIMADPCTYSSNYRPCLVMTVASLTETIRKSLGASASGVFCTSDTAWKEIERAGGETGDRVWRFPFWKHYSRKVTDYRAVDVNNVGKGLGGAPCLGAAFLLEFIPHGTDFMHLDISGTGKLSPGIAMPYLKKGLMSGRPTRTLIQFMFQMACPHEKGHECGE